MPNAALIKSAVVFALIKYFILNILTCIVTCVLFQIESSICFTWKILYVSCNTAARIDTSSAPNEYEWKQYVPT